MQVPPARSCSHKKNQHVRCGSVCRQQWYFLCSEAEQVSISGFADSRVRYPRWFSSLASQENFSLRMARAINFKFACILQTCILSEATSWWQTICQISGDVCTAFGVDGHLNGTHIKPARKSLILQEPALPTQLGQDLSFLSRYKSCRKTFYCLLASIIHASCLGHEIVSVIWVIWTTASEGWKYSTVKINLATSQK